MEKSEVNSTWAEKPNLQEAKSKKGAKHEKGHKTQEEGGQGGCGY